MRIVSFMQGTVVYGAAWEEIRPVEGVPKLSVMNALQEKYRFSRGSLSEAGQNPGFAIPHLYLGSLDDAVGIASLEFLSKGIRVTCATTEQAEAVIDDVLEFLKNSFGFRHPSGPRAKSHRSVIVSEFDFDFAETFEKWRKIIALINASVPEELQPFSPASLKFVSRNGDATSHFSFEKRRESPQGEEWWFTSGPVETKAHLFILEEMEKLFKE